MTQQIKAIDTVYNGYRFRSRLEARWAVFFDTLGVKYEYEKEGFDFDEAGRYLPDFWLPGSAQAHSYVPEDCDGVWIEIKPSKPSAVEEIKAIALAMQSHQPVFIFFGEPWYPNIDRGVYAYSSAATYGRRLGWSAWTECPTCHLCQVAPYGETLFLSCDCPDKLVRTYKDDTFEEYCGTVQALDGPRLHVAYLTARQARFEHGETPTP